MEFNADPMITIKHQFYEARASVIDTIWELKLSRKGFPQQVRIQINFQNEKDRIIPQKKGKTKSFSPLV